MVYGNKEQCSKLPWRRKIGIGVDKKQRAKPLSFKMFGN